MLLLLLLLLLLLPLSWVAKRGACVVADVTRAAPDLGDAAGGPELLPTGVSGDRSPPSIGRSFWSAEETFRQVEDLLRWLRVRRAAAVRELLQQLLHHDLADFVRIRSDRHIIAFAKVKRIAPLGR